MCFFKQSWKLNFKNNFETAQKISKKMHFELLKKMYMLISELLNQQPTKIANRQLAKSQWTHVYRKKH